MRCARTAGGLALLVLVSLLPVAWGCGNNEPSRYDLSGNVSFDGKPVPFGRIMFDPDTSKQNTGPQGFADIKDGAYDTANGGVGPIGGPHVIRITGYKSPPGGSSGVELLFLEQTLKEDLPKEKSTKIFDIPASAAKGVPTGPIAPP